MKLQFIEQVRSQNENLWLLYSTGVIHSRGVVRKVDLAGSKLERIDLPTGEPIEHFCIGEGGAILMVSSDRGVWQYSSGKTERITPLPPSLMPSLLISYGLGNDSPMSDYWNSGMVRGMGCPVRDRVLAMWSHSREIIILTSVSLMRFDCQRETWDILPLSHLIPKGIRMPACFAGNGDIILGTCLGEDGGQLTRIDTRTGETSLPFTGRQVTGVAKDPGNENCILFSTGTWHMGMNRGGVYRLKGEEISPVFESMAVFSMAPRKNSVVAATTAGICLIGKEGTRHADYPDPEDCEGIQVLSGKNFGTIVLTDIYRSNMISGTVPLIADEE